MESAWQVQAVWVDRDGRHTVRVYRFEDYADARLAVVRLFPHLGVVGCDERALESLRVAGDYFETGQPFDHTWAEGVIHP